MPLGYGRLNFIMIHCLCAGIGLTNPLAGAMIRLPLSVDKGTTFCMMRSATALLAAMYGS
jgi:hypothetical protein